MMPQNLAERPGEEAKTVLSVSLRVTVPRCKAVSSVSVPKCSTLEGK